MDCTLFDVTRGMVSTSDKPRAATDKEVSAYGEWLRERLGLPKLAVGRLNFREIGTGARAWRVCIGVTFGRVSGPDHAPICEDGAYTVIMPGHDAHRQTVTLETLGDAGEVVAASSMPQEPKKGGVIWSREDIRKAARPVAKSARGKLPAAAPALAAETALASAEHPIPVRCQVEPFAQSAPAARPIVEQAPRPDAATPADAGAPMFATLEDFKRAAVIGSRWRKGLWQGDGWAFGDGAPTRTVARVQSREIAFAWGDITPEQARHHGEHNRGNLAWLGFPKRGQWRSDGAGIIILYPDGTPNCRFDLLPPLEAAPAALEREAQAVTPDAAPDAPEALQQPEIATAEAEALPGDVTDGEPAAALDAVAQLLARVEALEAAVAANLSVKPEWAPSGEVVPFPGVVAVKPRRTAAHERAIRRAWAERAAARRQRAIAEDHMRMREHVQEALRQEAAKAEAAEQSLAIGRAEMAALAPMLARYAARRRASAQRARRMIAAARQAATAERQRAASIAGQLATLKRNLADPTQPERGSDIARLVRERDEARTALAASQARCERLQASTDQLAGEFEALAVRVARAEAAMRRAA